MTALVVAVLFALWAGAALLVWALLYAMGESEKRRGSSRAEDPEE